MTKDSQEKLFRILCSGLTDRFGMHIFYDRFYKHDDLRAIAVRIGRAAVKFEVEEG
jgi:hypothetical protein